MILSHVSDASRLTIRTNQGLIALEPRSARTIRIRYTREDELSRKPSLTVTPPPDDAPPVAFRVEDLPEALVLSTGALSVAIDRQTAAFTYRDSAGEHTHAGTSAGWQDARRDRRGRLRIRRGSGAREPHARRWSAD